MPLSTESSLGPYKIQSLIGIGAMGEVYRAHDTRLGRDVAIKILSARNADEEALRRFEAEAHAISALNHPNVLTIHDAGRNEDGVPFIVTELIEGQSLRQVLSTGELPMRKVLEYGLQIAEGLAAAHDEGIVHRDLKPENIMVARDGRIKILDFGIAKIVQDAADDSLQTLGSGDTVPGLVLGTTAYMSPEQAKGARVTYYADQFALGLIFYEMATGQPAFKRDTALASLSAVLTEDPPELEAGSMAFRWLVKRLLHKEPDHRYGSLHDVVRELRNLRSALTEAPTPESEQAVAPIVAALQTAPPRVKRRWLRPLLWVGALAISASLGFAGAWLLRSVQSIARYNFVPFAAGPGLDVFPAWSPNGRSVAFASEVDGVFQIFTRSSGAITAAQITRESVDALWPSWSADGRRIYYISGNNLKAVGATGGTPQLLLADVLQAAVSPNGGVAVLRRDSTGASCSLWLGTLEEPSQLTRYSLGTFGSHKVLPGSYMRFSPDGEYLGAWLALSDGRSEFWLIPAAGGEGESKLRSLSSSPFAREFDWMPGSDRIVFADRTGLSLGSHLLRAHLGTGITERLTAGTGSELSPSVAPSGRGIAFASAALNYDTVAIRFDGTTADLMSSTRFEISPAISSDGRMAFVTDRNGQPEIWLSNPADKSERPIVTPESFGEDTTAMISDTDMSPDGQRIAFRRSGSDDEAIWISTLNGDPPVRLAKEPGDAFQRSPSWSPDGNQIAYYSMRNGRFVLVRARVGGTELPAVFAENAGINPRWSPKGDLIATTSPGQGITLVTPDGATRRVIGTGEWLIHGWTREGTSVIGVRRATDRRLEIVSVRASDGVETILASWGNLPAAFTYGIAVGAPPLQGFSLTPDGRGFVTSILRASSDIWLLQR